MVQRPDYTRWVIFVRTLFHSKQRLGRAPCDRYVVTIEQFNESVSDPTGDTDGVELESLKRCKQRVWIDIIIQSDQQSLYER